MKLPDTTAWALAISFIGGLIAGSAAGQLFIRLLSLSRPLDTAYALLLAALCALGMVGYLLANSIARYGWPSGRDAQ